MDKGWAQISSDLARVVRGEVYSDILHRSTFSTDASIYQITPGCVVAPLDTTDIISVVKCARSEGIAVAACGAGSGVAGESLCSGIVFDMRRYMNTIIGQEDEGGVVECEAGVVLDDLNNYLSDYGRKIGPDPSTSNRATIGGCVANNATGAHSLEFGYIGDYVESIEGILADGTLAEFKNNYEPGGGSEELVSIAERCSRVLRENAEVIEKSLPESRRNRSGYNIAGICHNGRIDLAKLLAGSEGTLAVFTKVKLRTVAVVRSKALLQLEFKSLGEMARAVPLIVDSGASACELMDKKLMGMAVEALAEYRDILPVDAEAVLLVEHSGESDGEVKEKIEGTDSAVGDLASGRRIFYDKKQQERLWKLRKDAVPLLNRRKGRMHPVGFIEDVSVRNDRLGEYICGVEEIGKKYGIEMSFYGHAGDGELHIRPYLDLSGADGIKTMVGVANDVFSLAWSLGGTISGEHGEGLVRAAFVKRQYGEEFYKILCEIKDIFDPDGLLNPGKIINSDSDIMVKNLRAGHKFLPERLESDLFFEKEELRDELDQCNGCGLCLSEQENTRMCPVFRALGEELGSSRGKANVLRFRGTGQIEDEVFESAEFSELLDLCVNCKVCSVQCPSGVDVSKLVVAARAEIVKRKGLGRTKMVLSNNRYLSLLGSAFAPIANPVMKLSVAKWFLEKMAGLDRRRQMPAFAWGSFLKKGRKFLNKRPAVEGAVDKVAYFADTYVNFNDHNLGFAVLNVLRHNGIEVILPKQRAAPIPSICYGDVKRARKDLSYNVRYLAEAVRKGYKVVCSEPSAALFLRDELRHFVSGQEAKLVSENTYELMGYLFGLYREGKLKSARKTISGKYAYHLPCHLLALGNARVSVELLKELCGLEVSDLNAGCCGMAGTFGMQRENYELSKEISKDLKRALEETQAKDVLTECSACGMQIEHISGARVLHPVKVLAKCYGV